MVNDYFTRTRILIGEKNVTILREASVVVFGLGGVGGGTVEALTRAGIGTLHIVDADIIDITNINRQIIATVPDIGKSKVDVMKKRINSINPDTKVFTYHAFYPDEITNGIINSDISYVVDAIDSMKSKVELISECKVNNVPVISSMGTGFKLDPAKFRICDVFETKGDPMARSMRNRLRKAGIESLDVVFSDEEPAAPADDYDKKPIGSISFVPPVAGMLMAGYVIRKLIDMD